MLTTGEFSGFETVRYEGPQSETALAYRWYDAGRVVMGRPLGEHLRFAVAYWHSFVMNGADPFGAPTIRRGWMAEGDAMTMARAKADAAFEFFRILDVPFFCFHDRDVVAEDDSLAGTLRRLEEMTAYLGRKMESSRTKLLWGTANLFSHPRFMAGAATNPDPEVFAWSAATVKACMDATQALGGANYVLWGGREGYETLLNTDMGRELEQMGRFLSLVVEYKHRIGFTGQILIEPKPKEPTAHQYDFDAATVYGFLRRFGLEGEVKLNLEANHALLAGHSFEHEIATAGALGILGSLDVNRGDPLLGWDTDQFPNNLHDMTLAMIEVIRAGGLGMGGMNFDARIRRQSIDLDDLVAAHVGAMDLCARAFLIAAQIVEDGRLDAFRTARYAGWERPEAQAMLGAGASLEAIAADALSRDVDPRPRSGGQEKIENMLARFF
ncbi:xylose isomerase [Endobacter medicaginis]|uniref:Xylose isomerase n=2 Tax=Endobacter medicaginis TaxID=1181271 RepID=A0A839USW3_9PROT|nr:xylose isomerase [Endobacter medicaginis]MBB3173348.1 xylose isomerase [Endobacter medicaginis]MCX5476835.1 xylose isomerase [Endobacter medicaginis]NVN31628.1 xylose isomerase [Endobacter medicaginis]